MRRQSLIIWILFIFISAGITGGVLWHTQKITRETEMIQDEVMKRGEEMAENAEKLNKEKNQKFVVDVDPDINHWQTKETEFFTIKFPKEWYWMESDPVKTGYKWRIITNNSRFSINESFEKIEEGDIVISFHVSATSDSGTPQESIDSMIKATRQYVPSAICTYLSKKKQIPIIVKCFYKKEVSQNIQDYIIVNKQNTLIFSLQTARNTLVSKDIPDAIAKNIILQYID